MIVISIKRETGPSSPTAPKEPRTVTVTLENSQSNLHGSVELGKNEAVEHRVRVAPSGVVYVRIDGSADPE